MTIVENCRVTARLAGDTAEWAAASEQFLRARAAPITQKMRRHQDRANRLLAAASSPTGAGVFGASQTGKSYLINALARGTNPTLEIEFGDRTRDFLEEINPGGGRESTGIVTRFTVKPPAQTLPGYPVNVRLLTQMDTIKIFANSYYYDFDPNEEKVPTAEEIRTVLQTARTRLQPAQSDNMTDRDVDWLHVYIWSRFKSRRTVEQLETSGYWTELEELAPRLTIEDRAPLFALLWGGLHRFTQLHLHLCEVLKSIGFADTCCCEEKALIPRENSIIDAYQLHALADASPTTIAVKTHAGREASVPLPSLTALAAELQLQITKPAFDFQAHTDILDFPGARSRHSWKDAEEKLNDTEKLAEIILRGKVAYLFERYTEEFTLNSLVLCVRPGNQEVRSIPDYVTPWIEAVHGRSPAARKDQLVAFFLALTFFDQRFERKLGGKNSWKDAVHTSVVDLLGSTCSWVDDWTAGRPFTNTYWIRNPGFIAENLMTYDENDRETGVLNQSRIDEFKADYLTTENVRRYVANPDRAFDAAFELNDGGLTYLASKLGEVCQPELKRRQIRVSLTALLEDMLADLKPNHTPEAGSEEMLSQRREKIMVATRSLTSTLKKDRFGHFLRNLTVEQGEISAMLSRLPVDPEGDDEAERATEFSDDDIRELLGDLLGEAADEAEPGSPGVQAETANSRIAQKTIDTWTSLASRFVDDQEVLQFIGLSRECAGDIFRELEQGLASYEVKGRITETLDTILLPTDSPDLRFDKAATVGAEAINSFIMHLGQFWKPDGQRVSNKLGNTVFQKPARCNTLRMLEQPRHPRKLTFFADWCTALDALVETNVLGGKDTANSPANRALGALIEELENERAKI